MDLLNSTAHSSPHKNLTEEKWLKLKQLNTHPEIVIKKADKASAIIIMQTTDHLHEGYTQLNTLTISAKICAVLSEMKKSPTDH